ncbi:MAG: alanine--glyoxylate aminotransferase family protein [Bdellovibrionota bacterium]
MKKTYLLTPGPTPIPDSVLSALGKQVVHHRTPAFQSIFEEVKNGLKYIYQTRQDVLVLSCSGTGAMEAAVSNILQQNDKIITINAGKFGERWTKITKAYKLNPVEIKVELGEAPSVNKLEEIIKSNTDAKAILFQASETSTGVRLPTKEICKAAKAAGMLSICDAITACGVFDLPMDEWDIDVLISGSQKALMIPPGLASISLSEKAWVASEHCDIPHFYFDLPKERKLQAKNQTAWTPAISLLIGLQESLRIIKEEGLHSVFKRHELLARATRNAVQSIGLELFAQESPSPAVTAVKVPSSIKEGKKLPTLMRDKYGVTIAGGQDELEGKIIRLSHIGYCDKFDITTAIASLELALNELGHKTEYGKGVGAALQTFAEG